MQTVEQCGVALDAGDEHRVGEVVPLRERHGFAGVGVVSGVEVPHAGAGLVDPHAEPQRGQVGQVRGTGPALRGGEQAEHAALGGGVLRGAAGEASGCAPGLHGTRQPEQQRGHTLVSSRWPTALDTSRTSSVSDTSVPSSPRALVSSPTRITQLCSRSAMPYCRSRSGTNVASFRQLSRTYPLVAGTTGLRLGLGSGWGQTPATAGRHGLPGVVAEVVGQPPPHAGTTAATAPTRCTSWADPRACGDDGGQG